MRELRDDAVAHLDLLQRLAEQDASAYEAVVTARRLPKETDENAATRGAELGAPWSAAAEVPLRTAEVAAEVLDLARRIAPIGNPNAVSDAGVAAQLAASASVRGAILNVRINLPYLPADEPLRETARDADRLERARGRGRGHHPGHRQRADHAFVSAKILDGKMVASHLWRELSARVQALDEAGAPQPRLAIVRFDERGPSAVYASSLARAARSVGIEPIEIVPPDGVQLSDLAGRIGALNRDPEISGIVVAQPLPASLGRAGGAGADRSGQGC